MESINDIDLEETINISCLIIIDAIPDNEYQTGKLLEENLLYTLKVSRIKVHNVVDLDKVLLDIIFNISLDNTFFPIIHLEGHGDEKGFYFPDHSYKEWSKLAKCFSFINKLSKNNLIIYVASCYGINFIHSHARNASYRSFAACCVAIAPTKTIETGILLDSTTSFYKQLFTTGDINEAMYGLPSDYYEVFNATQMFIKVMTMIYERLFMGKGKRERYEYLLTDAIDKGILQRVRDISSARKHVKNVASTQKELERVFDSFGMSFLGPKYPRVLEDIIENAKKNK